LSSGAFSRAELIEILRDHIRTIVTRYRGRIADWDVVNEAVDESGELRRTIWLDGIGPEYLDIAFRTAHRADPSARLFYNDYGAEVSGPKRDGVIRLVQGLIDRGVPIDGVGLQMHTTSTTAPPGVDPPLGAQFFRPLPEKLADTMARYRAMGLVVTITEMDVRLRLPADSAALATQADVYRDVWTTCVQAPNCTGVTTWGFTDRYSWIPSFFTGYGAALPYDEQLLPKPAARVFPPRRAVR
jgi:endo-1,4-beta-xylanase